ncbi:MAG: winged helix-turn-helix transcriptional regulator [Candidatus Micrarchaeota archaeon]|nr:winged helix-turn-helix transcriptional regulator [Candidatus Micrarchaeota archaeon]
MSKTAETKRKIIEILKKEKKRLVDITPILGLSDSTVSQHLIELKEMGVIEEVEDNHFKNMKYYELKETDDGRNENQDRNKSLNGSFLIKVVIVLALISGLILTVSSFGSQKSVNLSLLLTDPSVVPNGTQQLYVNYSNVEIRFTNESNNWTKFNVSGSVDLLGLGNGSTVISKISIPTNSLPYDIRFNITAARIVINGTTYAVSVPESLVSSYIHNCTNLKTSNSGILIDFSPSVRETRSDNSTSFVLVHNVTVRQIVLGS